MRESGFKHRPRLKYPLATVIPYGPDDKTVTKLVVSIVSGPDPPEGEPLERWSGTNVASDENVAAKIHAFMRANGVKTVCTATAVLGCPHEEGPDFPRGEDCPFCPFWKGMQGSGSPGDPRWANLKSVRLERLGRSYRFWLPD